ncbi:unnamed protein product, partial [Allacma fusca]
WNLKGKVMG